MSKEAMNLALEALDGIYRYGLDTLSGRSDGLDDRDWQRAGVNEMTKRARFGITALKALAEQPAQQESVQNNPFDCGVYLGSGKDYAIKHHVSYGPAQQEPFGFAVMENPIAPPVQRTWVGLTPEQAVDLYKATETDNRMVLIDAVEAKLKEKNT